MTTAARLLTAEDLLALPGDARYELVDGELRTMSPAGDRHGEITARFSYHLVRHAEQHRLGTVRGAETGFILGRSPDRVRAPDAAFISRARLRGSAAGPGYFAGAPDLAVEVLSPGDTVLEVEDKLAEFFGAGCRLAWVVNPRRDTVTVYRPPPAVVRTLGLDEVLDGDDVLPGFRVPVRELLYYPDDPE